MPTTRTARRLVTAAAAAVLGVCTGAAALAHADTAVAAPTGPTAVVALGDSFTAGEGGGDYDPATNKFGDWCHRSAHAPIMQLGLPGVDTAVNLSCSGATTDALRLGGSTYYSEAPQVEQLKAVARSHRVKLVLVSGGMNDIPFEGMVVSCVTAYLGISPHCGNLWHNLLPARLAATTPKLVRVLTDVRSVMRTAGYADGDYQLVVESYTSPVPTTLRYPALRRPAEGCPFRDDDMTWAHDSAINLVNQAMRDAAHQVPGVRYLDLTGSFNGHELCAPGITHAQEWINHLGLNLAQLATGPGPNLVAESMHPNATGYTELARCLRTLYSWPAADGHCVPGDDGALVLRPE